MGRIGAGGNFEKKAEWSRVGIGLYVISEKLPGWALRRSWRDEVLMFKTLKIY
jgi:hypothetical protein